MIELPEGIYTGLLNNFGDLPFHISVVTSFAHGNNYPPQDPTYAWVKFTYPFLTDFISAIFVRCGATIRQAMFLENFVVAVAFVGLLHRWAFVLLRNRLAAVITPLLVILNGGFGWVMFVGAAMMDHEGWIGFLKSLPVSFTIIPETTWRWGNAVSTLLIPQRGFLLGLPLAVIVFTQWWLATNMEPAEAEEPDSRGARKGHKPKRVQAKRGAHSGSEISDLKSQRSVRIRTSAHLSHSSDGRGRRNRGLAAVSTRAQLCDRHGCRGGNRIAPEAMAQLVCFLPDRLADCFAANVVVHLRERR